MEAKDNFVASIDQSTTATKFQVFTTDGDIVVARIKDHKQITLKSGWLEHDPQEILSNLTTVIAEGIEDLKSQNKGSSELKCIGVTNQRETVVAWNKSTGKPYHNAVVWCDNRTKDITKRFADKNGGNLEAYKKINGLPISTYFSAFKIRWLIENVKEIADNLKDVRFGTMDSWIIYNLTGNYTTDVTNASRTFLMNIRELKWSEELLKEFGLTEENLPKIEASSHDFGEVLEGPLKGIKITACLGDQHAAAVGHGVFNPGDVKNTYGTGCFLMANTGTEVKEVPGLITTVCYKLGDDRPAIYALEGSIEAGASTLNWVKSKLGLFQEYTEIDPLMEETPDNGGVYFVPAFSGLLSPYWDDSATGTIVGLTAYASKAHIVRATLEALTYRTRDVIEFIEKNSDMKIETIKVDGGLTASKFLNSFQASVLQKKIYATCLGVALAAGWYMKLKKIDDVRHFFYPEEEIDFNPEAKADCDKYYEQWKRAVKRAHAWLE